MRIWKIIVPELMGDMPLFRRFDAGYVVLSVGVIGLRVGWCVRGIKLAAPTPSRQGAAF